MRIDLYQNGFDFYLLLDEWITGVHSISVFFLSLEVYLYEIVKYGIGRNKCQILGCERLEGPWNLIEVFLFKLNDPFSS